MKPTERRWKLSIVIPTYNEQATVVQVVRSLQSVLYQVDFEIIMVDDGSSDHTFEREIVLKHKDKHRHIKLFRNGKNNGKGASVRRGFRYASGDIVLIQDADMEYDPEDILKLIDPIVKGEVDVVYGSRFLSNGKPSGMSILSFAANSVLTWLTNKLYRTHFTDIEGCYKAFKKTLIMSLDLASNRFELDPEITSKLAKRHVKIKEMPIHYNGRTYGEGKKIGPWDFFAAVWVLVHNRFTELDEAA